VIDRLEKLNIAIHCYILDILGCSERWEKGKN
jgi:hypothetical protein